MNGSIAFAFVLATLGGLLTGAFALPVKFTTRWKWENTWLAFSFFGFLLIPAVVIGAAVPNLWDMYSQVPLARVVLVVVLGYLWGLGALTYGVGMDRLGIGLGSAFVLGIFTLVGTILPIFMAGTVSLKWAPSLGQDERHALPPSKPPCVDVQVDDAHGLRHELHTFLHPQRQYHAVSSVP
jgi:bacteriorhodopsin